MNRFEWLKAVLQDGDLPDRAKTIASVLAVQFANDDTGQINPSASTLADYIGASKDTVKRAVADLVAAGWIARTEGRGAGNRTQYTLLSPGKVVPFTGQKKGAELHLWPSKKGAELHVNAIQKCHRLRKVEMSPHGANGSKA